MWAWSVGMLNVHRNSSIRKPGASVGREERRDAASVARLTARAGEDQVVLRPVDARVPGLLAVDDPVVAVADGRRLHVRGVGAVLRLGDAEGEPPAPLGQVVDPLRLLLLACRTRASAAGRRCCRRSSARSGGRCAAPGPWWRSARGSPPSPGSCRPGRRTPWGTGSGSDRPRRPADGPRAATPPTARSAARPDPSRCGRPPGGGRRSGCCRPACSSGLISRSMNSSSSAR